jgi:hypothetical protein
MEVTIPSLSWGMVDVPSHELTVLQRRRREHFLV